MADNKDAESLLNIHKQLLSVLKENNHELLAGLDTTKAMDSLSKKIVSEARKRSEIEGVIYSKQRQINNAMAEFVRLSRDKSGVDNTTRMAEKISEIQRKTIALHKLQKNAEMESLRNQTLINKLGLSKVISSMKEINSLGAKNPSFFIALSALAVWIKIFKVFNDMDKAAAKFRMDMGITRKYTADIDNNMQGIAFELAQVGVSAEVAYAALFELSKTFGSTQYISKSMAQDVALMAAQLGIAQGTSAEFLKNMAIVGKDVGSSKTNMLLFASTLSEAAGTPLKDIMSDINNTTKSFYSYVTRSSLQLIKAAVEAKRMGTTLESSASSATKLLSFTSSVKDEMEASVLLGEAINLQRARELSYRRDLAGLNKEILKVLKETNFESLDPFQQESVAKALGKSASELSQMAQADRQRLELEKSQDKHVQQQLRDYKSMVNATEAIAKNQAENARHSLMINANQAAIASIAQSWNAIVQRLAQAFLPTIAKVLSGIANLLGKVNGEWLKWTGLIIGTPLLIFGVIKTIMVLRGAIAGIFGAGGRGGGLFGQMMGGVANGISKMGDPKVLAGAAAILILSASLIPLAFSLKLMEGVNWKTVGMMAVGLGVLTVAAFALGALMASGVGAVALLAGAAAIAILGAAMIPFAYAGKLASQAMKTLGEVNWGAIAKGIFTVGIQSPLIAAMGISMMAATPGVLMFSLALIPFSYSANKAGQSMITLGTGIKMVVDNIERLQNVSLIGTVLQVRNLAKAVTELSQALTAMPDIQVQKLEQIGIKGTGNTNNIPMKFDDSGIIDELKALRQEFQKLREDMGAGKLKASVSLDSQKVDNVIGRSLEFRGALA
jgi:hypothetical protein